MSDKCCLLRACFKGLLHAIYKDTAAKPASITQVTRKQKISSQSRLLEKEMDGWTDRQRGRHASSEKFFPKPLDIDKVQTPKSMASGGNSFRNIFMLNLGVLPNSVLLSSSTVNVSQETEIFSIVRAQCSSIFHLPLCAFYREVRSVRVNI